jgi:hypothetical protein
MRTGPAEQDSSASGPQPLIALLGFWLGCRPPSVGNGCAERRRRSAVLGGNRTFGWTRTSQKNQGRTYSQML